MSTTEKPSSAQASAPASTPPPNAASGVTDLPLRARLAKQLLHLVRSYGVPSLADGREMRISLHLAQEELAQLLGASRQRVNQELKAMEREETIRIEPGGLVVRNREALMRITEADD